MWSLGPHCHSVLRGYRFVDPQWEQDFQLQLQRWAVLPVRVYALIVLALSIQNIVDFRRYWSLKPGLVLHFCICGVCLFLFIGTFYGRFIPRHIGPLFAAGCCFIAVCHCYCLTENVRVWGDFAINHFVPLLLGLPDDDPMRQQAEWFIRSEVGTEAINVTFMSSYCHWVFPALLGFNRHTFATFAIVYVALCCTLLLDPSVRSGTARVTVFMATLTTVGFGAISVLMERLRRSNFLSEALLTQEMQASQMADSMLNHTLKNLLADVAANIEVYLDGSGHKSTLEDSVASLRRGMMACKERQVYLKLVSGEYVPVSQEVNLKEFGQQQVLGRAARVDAVDLSVYLDSTICSLILENALSNAFRHGHPQDPRVALRIEALNGQPHTRQGFQRIRFTVENAVDPLRPPLTPEDVERLFRGQARLVSNVRMPTLSDRVGIVHCVLAAQVGGVALSLAQSGLVVHFTTELDALVVSQPTVRSLCAWPVSLSSHCEQQFPSGLRFCCMDDSKPALRLLDLHLRKWCSPSSVHLFGHSEEEVQRFVPFAMDHADVVILDQVLEFSRTYYGTDLVRQLCERGFPGLVCIRSANDAAEDRERFRRAGAHCCFGKDVLGSQMTEELKAAYVQLRGGGHPSPPRSSDTATLVRAESLASLASSRRRPSDPPDPALGLRLLPLPALPP